MSGQFVILVSDAAWRVGCLREGMVHLHGVPVDADAPMSARAAAAREQLAQWGYAGEPVALALPSSWCLSATISTDGLERSGRRQAMAFQLEEHLPISAEETIAQFIESGNGTALGVCGELARLDQVIAALEQAEVPVRYVCPQAFLAAAHAVAGSSDIDTVLIGPSAKDGHNGGGENGYDMIEFEQGKPSRWWWLSNDEALTTERLRTALTAQGEPKHVALVACNGVIHQVTQECSRTEPVDLADLNSEEAAVRFASKVLNDTATPWINLRSGALAAPNRLKVYYGPAALLAAAMLLLLGSVIGVTWWRGIQYREQAATDSSRQEDVFKEALPDKRISVSAQRTLEREYERKRALAGGGAVVDAEAHVPALVQLRQVLGALPRDIRFRILELDIHPELIRVYGHARNHVDPTRIAAALRQSGHFEVEPPKTEVLAEGGVEFRFTAKAIAAAAGSRGDEP